MPEQTVAEYVAAQQAEWGVYVAAEPIYIDGARAFNAGDPVPASHVTNGVVVAEQVKKVTAKRAASADEKGN